MRQVQPGQTLTVTLDALPGKKFDGKVLAVNPLVDAAGRAIVIRAIVRNADTSLRPGMFTRISLITRDDKDALVVPEQAIVPQGEEQYVYRVVDGKAARVKVEIGQRADGKVEILKGLTAADVVVTAGQMKLRDGTPVTIVQSNGPASAAVPAPRTSAENARARAAQS
jgi:membrane fusion protein (multidrug efflux system)